MKKGQAAMEFLMTYGWAILVVLAAIGALAYFGVLSPDRFMPSKCLVAGGFSCVEYKMDDTTETVKIYLQNNLGVDASPVNVTLTNSQGIECAGANTGVDIPTLTNGQKSTVITFGNDATNCPFTASSFKGNIEVSYVRSGETESHTATGSISGKFE
ncbi:MAG: hypothetical protein KKF46_01150 [Nanoarchaeota archaeon]|nr:hypothetical protein [Nanoarchaeota archaeon]MBU1320940.1 hypothetical protein [Nanoarchaeota archaeon]MBU1597389.1 hypothetical protein [Nanoarchaeota archaeon]